MNHVFPQINLILFYTYQCKMEVLVMLSHKKQQIPIKYLPLCALLRNVHNHDHQTYLSQNLSQTYGAALPRINTV